MFIQDASAMITQVYYCQHFFVTSFDLCNKPFIILSPYTRRLKAFNWLLWQDCTKKGANGNFATSWGHTER